MSRFGTLSARKLGQRLATVAGAALVWATACAVFYLVFSFEAWVLIRLTVWLGIQPDMPWSLFGWGMFGGLITLLLFDAFRPGARLRAQQRACMHHDPDRRNPNDGAPTVSWIATDRPATGRRGRPYRRDWCTHCRKVWSHPL